MWQAPRQQCRRDACQISARSCRSISANPGASRFRKISQQHVLCNIGTTPGKFQRNVPLYINSPKPMTWPWASYQIRKIAGCACVGNAGNVFPHHWLQRKTLVSNPGMHHGTCVTHVPWWMPESLVPDGGENVPGIPGACAPAIFRIWQEAHAGIYFIKGLWAHNWNLVKIFLVHIF